MLAVGKIPALGPKFEVTKWQLHLTRPTLVILKKCESRVCLQGMCQILSFDSIAKPLPQPLSCLIYVDRHTEGGNAT